MARIIEDQKQIIQEASLKTIVEEQRKVIEDQNKTIQNLTAVIKDLTTVFEIQEKNLTRTIENLTKNIEEQKQMLDRLDTRVYFSVGLNADTSFPPSSIMKFNRTITNMGGGYVDYSGDPNYGKFIVPLNGTYRFSANVYSGSAVIGGDLMVNGILIIGATNGNEGAGSLNAVVDLQQDDEVCLLNPYWVSSNNKYDRYFTIFTGFLLHADG